MASSTSDSMYPSDREEGGNIVCEPADTWVIWKEKNLQKIDDLKAAVKFNLHQKYGDTSVDSSDSDEGAYTMHLRYQAVKNKITFACKNWMGYDSYRIDFEGRNSSSDSIVRGLRRHVVDRPSTDEEIPTPKKKKTGQSITVADAETMIISVSPESVPINADEPMEFDLCGMITSFKTNFFTENPPITDGKNGNAEYLITELEDFSGSMLVALLAKACHDVFEMSPTTLQRYWKEGASDIFKQDTILKELNAKILYTFNFRCFVGPTDGMCKQITSNMILYVRSIQRIPY